MRNNPRDRLLTLHRAHVKAWEQQNIDLLRSLYSDQAVIFDTVPPSRFSDFKTFENTLQQYFGRIGEISMLTSNIQIEIQGDVAWITSQYIKAYQVEGRVVRESGRWTEVYLQTDDDWKVAHLHASPSPEE